MLDFALNAGSDIDHRLLDMPEFADKLRAGKGGFLRYPGKPMGDLAEACPQRFHNGIKSCFQRVRDGIKALADYIGKILHQALQVHEMFIRIGKIFHDVTEMIVGRVPLPEGFQENVIQVNQRAALAGLPMMLLHMMLHAGAEQAVVRVCDELIFRKRSLVGLGFQGQKAVGFF